MIIELRLIVCLPEERRPEKRLGQAGCVPWTASMLHCESSSLSNLPSTLAEGQDSTLMHVVIMGLAFAMMTDTEVSHYGARRNQHHVSCLVYFVHEDVVRKSLEVYLHFFH